MKVTPINDYKDIHQDKETVLVLGYFDALHRGHKVLFDKARQIADEKQLEVAVFTFNESPQLTFQRYTDDLLLHITAPQRRCDLFKAYTNPNATFFSLLLIEPSSPSACLPIAFASGVRLSSGSNNL